MTTDPASGAPTPSKLPSDTPETDAEWALASSPANMGKWEHVAIVMRNFAQTRERQNAELRAALELAEKTLSGFVRSSGDEGAAEVLPQIRAALAKGREGRGT